MSDPDRPANEPTVDQVSATDEVPIDAARADGATSRGGPTDVEPVVADPPPLPGRVVMRQRWADLAYFHWRYPADVVQALLPDEVTVDTHDGDAWVGLIPFVMRDVRIGPLPPIPHLGTFVEINVRTYVVDPVGRRAVWFWSLDVPRSPIVAVARTLFSLPYCWSSGADHDEAAGLHRYSMRRTWPRPERGRPRATADLSYRVGERIPDHEVTELDHFLSARWALLTVQRGRLRYGRIHHERWPLHRVHEPSVRQTALEAAGLPSPAGDPHVLCTPGVDVGVSWFERR